MSGKRWKWRQQTLGIENRISRNERMLHLVVLPPYHHQQQSEKYIFLDLFLLVFLCFLIFTGNFPSKQGNDSLYIRSNIHIENTDEYLLYKRKCWRVMTYCICMCYLHEQFINNLGTLKIQYWLTKSVFGTSKGVANFSYKGCHIISYFF